MILKKMLKQARGDSRPEVRIGVCTPFPCEAPDFLRVGLDIVSNADDALPARVQLAFGGFLAWENPLCIPYGVGDTHLLSQRQRSGTAAGDRCGRQEERMKTTKARKRKRAAAVAWTDLLGRR
jgi:hypothetical protein